MVLVVMPAWGYLIKDAPSITSLIPAVFGVLLLACYKPIKKQNKNITHVAVVLTLLVFLLLIMPLRFVILKEDMWGTIRVSAMMITSFLALIAFVKHFIDVRKPKKVS